MTRASNNTVLHCKPPGKKASLGVESGAHPLKISEFCWRFLRLLDREWNPSLLACSFHGPALLIMISSMVFIWIVHYCSPPPKDPQLSSLETWEDRHNLSSIRIAILAHGIRSLILQSTKRHLKALQCPKAWLQTTSSNLSFCHHGSPATQECRTQGG